MGMRFNDQGSRFRVQGSGFRVQDSGFRVQGSRFRVQGSISKVQGSRFRVRGSGVYALSAMALGSRLDSGRNSRPWHVVATSRELVGRLRLDLTAESN